MKRLNIWRVGQIDYEEALALQEGVLSARQDDRIPDTLLLLEHPPTITLGRGAAEKNILLSPSELAAAGVSCHAVGRGGDVTYHGPGQLVGYPVLDLKPDRMDVRKYVQSLEETMIRLCADENVTAERLDKFNGTWIEPLGPKPRKIGAVGVRISRWVTQHGFAFNVSPNLEHFKMIVPCGLQDKGVTSLSAELGSKSPTLEDVMQRAGEHFAEIHDMDPHWFDGKPSLNVG